MKTDSKKPAAVSYGVDALIAQVRDEGVAAGRTEAARLVAEAQSEAARLIDAARSEARRTLTEAEAEVQRVKKTCDEALVAAKQNAILALRQQLLEKFSADVRRLVSEATVVPDLVQRMIMEVASGARDAAGVRAGEHIVAVLPREVAEVEDLRQEAEALRGSPLTQLVLARAGAVLTEGIVLVAAGPGEKGLLLRLREGALEIDLSDEAIASVLLAHLQPRFRSLFEGVVR